MATPRKVQGMPTLESLASSPLLMPSAHACTERQNFAVGTPLLARGTSPQCVTYVESGRVALGVMEGHLLAHQLGVLQGPVWLEASAAVLNLPSLVDAITETDVVVRCVPVSAFRQSLVALPQEARTLLHDVAMAHRQQAELAVSRFVKDAQSRCAEWLLAHAEVGDKGTMAVRLNEPKRQLAAKLGIAPETLSRVLRHLRDRGLISGTGRVVNVLDSGCLRSLAGV